MLDSTHISSILAFIVGKGLINALFYMTVLYNYWTLNSFLNVHMALLRINLQEEHVWVNEESCSALQ